VILLRQHRASVSVMLNCYNRSSFLLFSICHFAIISCRITAVFLHLYLLLYCRFGRA